MAQAETLAAVKLSMGITVDAYDSEISDLIDAGIAYLQLVTGKAQDETDKMVLQTIKTYCRAHFRSPADYDRLIKAFDSMVGTLMISTGYTDWGGVDG